MYLFTEDPSIEAVWRAKRKVCLKAAWARDLWLLSPAFRSAESDFFFSGERVLEFVIVNMG